jgi:PAS domain S-box-containing protein
LTSRPNPVPADAGEASFPRSAVLLLIAAGAVVIVSFGVEHAGVPPTALRFLDNTHWIVAHTAAALVAWIGVRSAPAADHESVRWFARGLTFYAVGEIVYGIQIVTGWNPFPGPADVLTLCAGPCCWAGMLDALRSRLSAVQRRQVLLDSAAFAVALLTLTLALYLPRRGSTSPLALIVLVAYPVGLLTAGSFGMMLIPTLRLQHNRGVLIMVGSLFLMGLLWMRWNLLALDDRLEDGTLFNAIFSFGALALGVGALMWQIRPAVSVTWDRRFDATLRMLPLVMVICAAAAVILVTLSREVSALVQSLVVAGAVATSLLAIGRQHLLLVERDRLLESERHLLEAERRFRTLFESAMDSLVLLDGPRFLEGNPSTHRLFRVGNGQLSSLTPAALSPERQPDGTGSADGFAERLRAAEQGEGQFFEWRFQRLDGSDFDAEVSLNLLESGAHPLVYGTIHDISERRRAEAVQRRLEADLHQALRLEAIGRLAGGVAHDFNNILTVILGAADMVLQEADTEWPGRADLQDIRRAGQRAADLTSQLLAFSRKQVVAPIPLNLNRLIRDAVSMLERLIGDQVTLRFHPAPIVGVVRVDPTQVEQILINLAVNARDAMPGGGVFTIETGDVELDAVSVRSEPGLAPGPFVRLRLSDNGTGMDAETRARLFEPFFTTKELGKGTGLGLSTIHGIVRQSGGLVQVESLPGIGTTFLIYLPRIDEPAVVRPRRSRRNVRGRDGTVLLVEDDEAVRRVTCRMLEEAGYVVLTGAGLEEALEVARTVAGPLDLLVTDVILRGSDGREVRSGLHKLRPGLPVLFISGHTAEIIGPHEVLEPGAHFLQKPFTAEALARAVREAMDEG